MHLHHFWMQKVSSIQSSNERFPTSISRKNYIQQNEFIIISFLDDEEDEEDEAYYTDAFDGMKQRMTTLNGKTDKMEKVR